MVDGRNLTVHAIIKPASRRPGVKAEGGTVRVAVKSPPIEGRANAEAAALLADAFGVSKTRVELLRGARSRIKHFRIVNPTSMPERFEPWASRDAQPGCETGRLRHGAPG